MAWKPTITIDGVEIPLPDNYSQTISDLSSDESGTMLDGTTYKDIIGTQASIPFKYGRVEWNTAATIANAVNAKNGATLTYPDIRNPYSPISREVYFGNRKSEIVENNSDGTVYWSLEFNAITKDGEG